MTDSSNENLTAEEWAEQIADDLQIASDRDAGPSGSLTYEVHPEKPGTLIMEFWDEERENVLATKHVRLVVEDAPEEN